jgi:hypothetical protein
MAKNITKENVLEAIKGSQGLVSKVKRKLEEIIGETVCWDTVDAYIHKWPEAEAAVRAEKELMLDLAENNVFKALSKDDLATSKWYLKMKGKERGYVETQEIITDVDPLNINLSGGKENADALKNSPMVEVSDAEESTE